jgi:hypothetical protein
MSTAEFPKLWSTEVRQASEAVRGGFGRKSFVEIVSDTERMKTTPTHICIKTVFVGWPSTESRRISSFPNLLSCNHYFRKYFKLVYRRNVVTSTLTTGMFFLFACGELYECGPRLPKIRETLDYSLCSLYWALLVSSFGGWWDYALGILGLMR